MDENKLLKVACVQMISSVSVAKNLVSAEQGIVDAVKKGANVVVLPEYFCLMGQNEADKLAVAEVFSEQPSRESQPLQYFLREQATLHGVYLISGTVPIRSENPHKVYNTCIIYGPNGCVEARYDKIHLFGFNNGTESYNESDSIMAGALSQTCVWQSPWGRIGIAICYDLRFPELFRQVGDVLAWIVMAAFTNTTGQAHWEILLRARAIENQCYVVACGQGGLHDNGRRTFGHSMIIDAWGTVQTALEFGEGILVLDLLDSRTQRVRDSLPALKHRVIG